MKNAIAVQKIRFRQISSAVVCTIIIALSANAQEIEKKLEERVIRYIGINTESVEDGKRVPTSEGQTALANLIADELNKICDKKGENCVTARVDEYSYVYADVKGNSPGAPTIFLSAHLDTSPDGELNGRIPKVKAINYNGGAVKVSDKITLDPDSGKEPYLKYAVGGRLLTSDGETLLGGDDKAGVAIAITLAEHLLKERDNLKYGDIKLVFTTDEEIGFGTKYFAKSKLMADYGLVFDGRGIGRLAVQNFNAADFTVTIKAPPAGHPGMQSMPRNKDIQRMIEAKIPESLRVYNSSGEKGYIDIYRAEDTKDGYILKGRVREFDRNKFEIFKDIVINIVSLVKNSLAATYGMDAIEPMISLHIKDAYSNSKAILDKHPENYEILMKAYDKAGAPKILESARGGSDANDITYMGIPTYNLFAGYYNDHAPSEWISIRGMKHSFDVALNYITGWAEKYTQTVDDRKKEIGGDVKSMLLNKPKINIIKR